MNKLVLHASGVGGALALAHTPAEGLFVMAETFEDPTLASMRKMMNCFLYEGDQYSDEDLLLQARLDAWLGRPDAQEARRNSKSIQRDLSADLHQITVPVLQLHGRNDRIAHLESALRLLSLLPDSRLMVFNHCGHWVPIERPAEFCRPRPRLPRPLGRRCRCGRVRWACSWPIRRRCTWPPPWGWPWRCRR